MPLTTFPKLVAELCTGSSTASTHTDPRQAVDRFSNNSDPPCYCPSPLRKFVAQAMLLFAMIFPQRYMEPSFRHYLIVGTRCFRLCPRRLFRSSFSPLPKLRERGRG